MNMNSLSSNHLCQIASLSLLILLSLTNCSPPEAEIPEHLNDLENLVIIQPNSEHASSIELIQDAVIDDNNATKTWFKDISSGGFPFGGGEWFAGLEIDDSGRIYVGNRPETAIQVFSSEGSYLTKVGSEGNGPGEFNGITSINIESDRLSVFDYLQFRTTFFSIEPLKVDEVQNVYLNRSPDIEELTGWHANQIKFIDGDTFLVGYMEHPRDARVGRPTYNLDKERPIRYYFADREGEVLSDILFEIIDDDIITADVNGRHLYNWAPLPFLDVH